jgi:aldehyde dehydrogenase (NAD+)
MGVVGLITPWNWPLNQIALKVAPCLAAGNTMVLKPSEECPGNAAIFAEILDAAGVPAGVFNLVQGDGPTVGEAISAHPGIDMVSFTGSTRAGILVAKAAADTVKRVHQELGGKSPNLVLPDADLPPTLPATSLACGSTGQSCISPARILVHKDQEAEPSPL